MSRPADVRAWRQIKLEVLDDAGYRCAECGKPGRLEVDHIVPLWRGGAPYDKHNLQALCRGCHIEKSKADHPHRQAAVAGQQAWRDKLAKYIG